MVEEPPVAVVVVSFETRDLTLQAVASAERSEGVDVEVWVVDNASTDGSAAAVRERHPRARVLELPENVGFGRANNAAFGRIEAPWILLLNSDAVLPDPGSLRALLDVLRAHPRVGVVGPRLEDEEGRLQFSVRAFPSVAAELVRGLSLHRCLSPTVRARLLGGEFVDYEASGSADWLAGACLLVRREVLDEVGGFDPAIFMYGEELEWMWRVRRAGWRVRYHADVTVRHLGRGGDRGGGGWQRRAAMAGDAYVVRARRGGLYLGIFALARAARFLTQWGLHGLLGLLGNRERMARSREARRNFRAWIVALARGGHTAPDRPSFLPPHHRRAGESE